jgi:hypothetical protein
VALKGKVGLIWQIFTEDVPAERIRFSVLGRENADKTDLTDTHGFFNCVENLRIIADFWPLRDHCGFF